ncbi:acyl-CoA dehydrogenase family protein [Roseivirga echinicomitans]
MSVFSSLRKFGKVVSQLDISETLEALGKLNQTELYQIMKIIKSKNKEYVPPEINGDYYHLSRFLTPEEREIQLKVREFMNEYVKPIANDCWNKAHFPMELIPKMAELNIAGLTYEGYDSPMGSYLLEGFITMEMARVDTSISTFFGVQSGLAMGSIYFCGSEEQKWKWLPAMQKMEKIGAFGLTEPNVGSAVAGGLETTCKRDGDSWLLNGQKKWIGNATFADLTIIWARDLDDNQVKGFIVEKGTKGFKAEKQEDKMALRTVQNALITLTNCEISEENRLQECNSFKDTAKVLKATRAGVAWQAVGCARGAYECALEYSTQRYQFGKPIASFQLVQDLLVQMLTDLTAIQSMAFHLSKLQDEGTMTDQQASLAKVACTKHTREIVGHAREIFGGNGILLEYNIARFVADAEALYTYEGTKEVNSLIVGRDITGISAFV